MIDWNEAPKEATHHGKFENHECWYQVDGGEVFSWETGSWGDTYFWHDTCWEPEKLTANNEDTVIFTPRPVAAQENGAVKNPKHYQTIEGYESIEVIACSLTAEQWKGFCLGNILKYRIRAGKKDLLQQDIDKANNYEVLHEKYKHLCREDK